MIKVCYILPFYEEGTDTHLFYNYLLIRELKKRGDIGLHLIVEKDQIFKWPPARVLELFLNCLNARISGYKNFYVHYSYYGALAGWLAGGKVFYWNRGMTWLFKRGWFEEQVFRFILRHSILATGPKSLAEEYALRYGVKKYRVLSNWVDVERWKPWPGKRSDLFGDSRSDLEEGGFKEAGESKKTVLFVHHLSKRKGADLIPEIAKGFGENVLFLVIGDGPEMDNLKPARPAGGLEIRNLKLNNVRLLGKIPNSEIPKYFHAADVFLMPSREEGSPHVLLEAMASGIPFVASDVGGVRELVPRELEGFLCKSEDIKCFQERIKTLLSDKALYDKARELCLRRAQNFDISRGVEEFINLFK